MNAVITEPSGCYWPKAPNNYSETFNLGQNHTKLLNLTMRCSPQDVVGIIVIAGLAILVWIVGGQFWYLLYHRRIARTLNNYYLAVFVLVIQLECVIMPLHTCLLGTWIANETVIANMVSFLRVAAGSMVLVDRLLYINLGIHYNKDRMRKIGAALMVTIAVCAVCYGTVGSLYSHVPETVLALNAVLLAYSLMYNIVVVIFSVVVYRINNRTIRNVPQEHQISADGQKRIKLLCLCIGYAVMSLLLLLKAVIWILWPNRRVTMVARDYKCIVICAQPLAAMYSMLWFMYTNKDVWLVFKKRGMFRVKCNKIIPLDVPASAN